MGFFYCVAKIAKCKHIRKICRKNRENNTQKMKISVCESCGEVYDYTGYPTCPECIRDGDTTKKDKEIPKLLQKDKQDAIFRSAK